MLSLPQLSYWDRPKVSGYSSGSEWKASFSRRHWNDTQRRVWDVANSAISRFLRTPKGLLTIVLVILTALAAPHEGIARVAPGLFSAVVTAGVIDFFILRKVDGA